MIDFEAGPPAAEPLPAPAPRHPDQMMMFETSVDTTVSVGPGNPMTMFLVIKLHRTERRRCSYCGKRRICFYVGLGDAITSPPLCAKDAGIR